MERQIINEDEIDLRELFLTIWENKIFITILTVIVTLGAIVYTLMHKPTPLYQGKVLVEIGEILSENFGSVHFDNPNDLSKIINNTFNVNASSSKGTRSILEITATNPSKEKIKEHLQDAVNFIIARHQNKAKFYNNYIMTKQVGKIAILNQPINEPKKQLIIVVAFATGLILSIFLVFFKEFIKSFKNENIAPKT